MSFFRSLLLLTFISLFAALVLFFLGSVMGYVEYRGGYAVLETSESVEEEKLIGLLDGGKKYYGGNPVSESSQWVLLDEFGSLEMIPLPQYEARLFPFDPRNDGYAGKLKNIFVRDGKRFVYVPLKTAGGNVSLDRQFENLLGGISFSVNYFGVGKPVAFFFITYAAASLLLIIICYVKKSAHPGAANIISLLPALSSLVFFGAAGIASAALLLGLFVMLREPLCEIVTGKINGFKSVYNDIFKQYGLYWFLLPVFALALAVFVIFSQLKLLFLLAVFSAACVIFLFSIRTFSLKGGKHRRFTPVLIRKKTPDFAFSAYMLPLAAAAFFVILFTPFLSYSFISDKKFDHIIEEQDYYAHLAFQAAFSTRQLGNSGAVYPSYLPGEDGLPSLDTEHNANLFANIEEFPHFPLKHLMDFFDGVNTGSGSIRTGYGGGIVEKLSLLLLLIFIIPGFFLKGKISSESKGHFTGFKRFSAKLRWSSGADINRKKVLLYNNKNTLRLRKDA